MEDSEMKRLVKGSQGEGRERGIWMMERGDREKGRETLCCNDADCLITDASLLSSSFANIHASQFAKCNVSKTEEEDRGRAKMRHSDHEILTESPPSRGATDVWRREKLDAVVFAIS